MAAPTNAANVKKALANSEPSTHGTLRQLLQRDIIAAIGGIADVTRTCHNVTV
jgi:hypothetical protein